MRSWACIDGVFVHLIFNKTFTYHLSTYQNVGALCGHGNMHQKISLYIAFGQGTGLGLVNNATIILFYHH